MSVLTQVQRPLADRQNERDYHFQMRANANADPLLAMKMQNAKQITDHFKVKENNDDDVRHFIGMSAHIRAETICRDLRQHAIYKNVAILTCPENITIFMNSNLPNVTSVVSTAMMTWDNWYSQIYNNLIKYSTKNEPALIILEDPMMYNKYKIALKQIIVNSRNDNIHVWMFTNNMNVDPCIRVNSTSRYIMPPSRQNNPLTKKYNDSLLKFARSDKILQAESHKLLQNHRGYTGVMMNNHESYLTAITPYRTVPITARL